MSVMMPVESDTSHQHSQHNTEAEVVSAAGVLQEASATLGVTQLQESLDTTTEGNGLANGTHSKVPVGNDEQGTSESPKDIKKVRSYACALAFKSQGLLPGGLATTTLLLVVLNCLLET